MDYLKLLNMLRRNLIGGKISRPDFKIYREINGKFKDRIKTLYHKIENNSAKNQQVQLQVTYDKYLTPHPSSMKFNPPVKNLDF